MRVLDSVLRFEAMRWGWMLVVVSTMALGCKADRTLTCAGASDCVRGTVEGECLVPGYCAFFDSTCDDMRRWDSTAAAELADECVKEDDVTPDQRNSCGGLVVLGAATGDDCGLCNRGRYECDGLDALACVDEPADEEAGVAVENAASSIFQSNRDEYGPAKAIDGLRETAWFSDGEDGGAASYRWRAGAEECITSIEVAGNALHPMFAMNYGFAQVTVEVVNGNGEAVYSERHSLPGTPDPDLMVDVNREGIEVNLLFEGAESPECGGFSELFVTVAR